jgi:hypothetical protein
LTEPGALLTFPIIPWSFKQKAKIAYRYPEVIKALKQAAGDCILDGEMAIFSTGVPDFSSLAVRGQQIQNARIDYLSKAMPASYIVFDILYKGQESLMIRPSFRNMSIPDDLRISGPEIGGPPAKDELAGSCVIGNH